MPDLFDRLGDFLRSLFKDEENKSTEASRQKQFYDPDMQDAWEELEEYLQEGKNTPRKEKPSATTHSEKPNPRNMRIKALQETLRPDYARLKVQFAAPFDEVKKAYKKLLRQYHPDRYADNAERSKAATEITQKIVQSFQKIKSFEEKKEKL